MHVKLTVGPVGLIEKSGSVSKPRQRALRVGGSSRETQLELEWRVGPPITWGAAVLRAFRRIL